MKQNIRNLIIAQIVFILVLLNFQVAFADVGPNESDKIEFEAWVNKEYQISIIKMLANFNRPDTIKGTIIASPSRENPNYYYHWVRDASVAISCVFLILNHEKDQQQIVKYKNYISDFIEATKIHQSQNTPAGNGEVKFLPNGLAYLGPWGRPQTDGPAIRALVLSFYANYLLNRGEENFVRSNLYASEWPATSVIKRDLEYISNHWQQPSFDMWEEVYANHFFDRYIQVQALLNGALIAEKLKDFGAAFWYRTQSANISASLLEFWNIENKQIDSMVNFDMYNKFETNKISNLDTSVLLAIMAIGGGSAHTFGVSDDRVMATVFKLKETFKNLYPINQKYPMLAPGIGRYSEDQYDGYKLYGVGNPWFLTTAAMASYTYRLAWNLKLEGQFIVTELNQAYLQDVAKCNVKLLQELTLGRVFIINSWQFNALFVALFKEGDSYLKRIRLHMGADGSMSEQFNRNNGYMQGANDLTMSYTAFIRAVLSRRNLLPF